MAQLGRPRSDNPRTESARCRMTRDERATVEAAADRAGLSVAEWMRTTLLRAAKRQR